MSALENAKKNRERKLNSSNQGQDFADFFRSLPVISRGKIEGGDGNTDERAEKFEKYRNKVDNTSDRHHGSVAGGDLAKREKDFYIIKLTKYYNELSVEALERVCDELFADVHKPAKNVRLTQKEEDDKRYSSGPLRENEEFVAHVVANLWENRRDRGLPWRTNVFEFIMETYEYWIRNHNMCQADLKGLDDKLYIALRQRQSKGVQPPPHYYLPTRWEASLKAIEDPYERCKASFAREAQRDRAAQRAKKREFG